MSFRVGQGFDFHPMESGRKLVLGGVEIAYEKGLKGHSDADVAVHALANAVLGAIGEGDLGRHFRDDDPRYENAKSIKLLEEVWQLAASRGWALVNADLTIIAQQPRLAEWLEKMRHRLAAALKAQIGQLNVKAASPERLGALGRGEGIGAAAIVMLSAQ